MKSILLAGGGGHCRSSIDVIEKEGKYKVAGIVERVGGPKEPVLGYPIVGTDNDTPSLISRHNYILVTIGQIRDVLPRKNLFLTLSELGFSFPTVYSPFAYVSKHAQVDIGTIVMHHALVNAGAKIGANCIINSKALVEHDSEIADHCHISTSSVVNGGVIIGSGTFIGSCAIIREGIKIGGNCFIAAGSIVTKSIANNTFYRNL